MTIMNHIITKSVPALTLAFGLAGIIPSMADEKSEDSKFDGRKSRPDRTWTITRPGVYKLERNISISGSDAIVIRSSNVTLDLNGYSITSSTPGTGRGITAESVKNVSVLNGSVSGFNINLSFSSVEAGRIKNLQIVGAGLAPNGGPSEIGVLLVNSRACTVVSNIVTSVNLGVFVRGGQSTGNRIERNVIVGGTTDSSNLLGICYNPAPDADSAGPVGDSIYNNHISRFNFAISVSEGSKANLFVDNTLSSFTGPFRDPAAFEAQGGSNAEFDNSSTVIPVTTP